VWGAYRPLHERDKTYTRKDGSTGTLGTATTKPREEDRGRVFLDTEVIARHYAGLDPGHIAGLHATNKDNTSLWAAVDLDQKEKDPERARRKAECNWAAALAWYNRLVQLGFVSLLEGSNGAGADHLWGLFNRAVPTQQVRQFMEWLTQDYADYGIEAKPEIFPKQAGIGAEGYGNWLRLPGRHHTYDHWSRIWDGTTWLDGAAAIDYILSLEGSDPALML